MAKTAIDVLLVEDDKVDEQGLRRAFRKAGLPHRIHLATDGLAALRRLRGEGGKPPLPRPHVVLLDLNLPRMNGVEFLQSLRNDEALKDTFVIVITTSDAEEDKVRAYRLNVAGYFLKARIGDQYADAVTLMDRYWSLLRLPRQ